MNIFDRIVRFLDSTEVSFVTLLAKIIPLLVPIIPAYVGYKHVTNTESGLGFDPLFGWVYGAVIEGLGYSAIYKAVQFWENNRKETKEENQAPLFGAIIIYVVYLVVTLAVNVMLDYQAGVESYKVIALGLISLLSVPAGLLMSISAVHTERKTERERAQQEAREERKAAREQRKAEEEQRRSQNNPVLRTQRTRVLRTQPQNVLENKEHGAERPLGFPTDTKAGIEQYVMDVREREQRTPGAREVARAVGCAPSYAHTVLKNMGEQQ